MSERDELRQRLIPFAIPDGAQLEMDPMQEGAEIVDAILQEIERTHVLVPLPGCDCEDCYPELTAVVGVPVPEGITSVTWGWGELPKEDS